MAGMPSGVLTHLAWWFDVNLATPCNKCDETIAKQVDAMALVNMSSHFCQW
jgi:hypothetical protein